MKYSMDKQVNMDKQVKGALFTCLCKIVWWRYLSMRGYFVFVLLLVIASIEASCSDDSNSIKNDSTTPKGELIVTPIPNNAEPYKIYAVKHFEKKDFLDEKCTFIFNFGDNPKNLSNIYVQVLDKKGNVIVDKTLYPPSDPDYISADDSSYREEYNSDAIIMLSFLCENSIAYFKYSYDIDDDGWNETIKQPWETVHHYYLNIE